jgi:chorismate-pyruvate lyase
MLILAAASAKAEAPRAEWPATAQGRLAADAALHALSDQLLAQDSATLVLDDWCATHHMAANPKIVAERVHDGDHGVPDAIRTLLKVGPTEVVGYRHVRLRCGAHVLSDADNWYVPGRLTAAINRQLDTTDIPFGRAAKPLQFRRFTLASKHVWSPLPADWATLPVSQWPVQAALELPVTVLENHAVLLLPNGDPISAVIERYSGEVLAFAAQPVAR